MEGKKQNHVLVASGLRCCRFGVPIKEQEQPITCLCIRGCVVSWYVWYVCPIMFPFSRRAKKEATAETKNKHQAQGQGQNSMLTKLLAPTAVFRESPAIAAAATLSSVLEMSVV